MKPSPNEQQKSYLYAKIYICKWKFEDKYAKNKKYVKARDHCHYTREDRGAAHSIWNLKYSVHKEIPIFHFFTMDLTMIISS